LRAGDHILIDPPAAVPELRVIARLAQDID
jgi:hypothetical protein